MLVLSEKDLPHVKDVSAILSLLSFFFLNKSGIDTEFCQLAFFIFGDDD